MGAKDSKPCCINYEEAIKRVTDAELKRIKEAFKRVSTINGCITKESFFKEVLGDGVPLQIGEQIFSACGGTQKGIGFKDLICGLVLLTRGTEEEKLKFLFGLYATEGGNYIVSDELYQSLEECECGYNHEAVAGLFKEKDRVTYETFSEWILVHPDATLLSRWFLSEPCMVTLSNDLETPTFYQTLAGVTHLDETDIIELEKQYWLLKGQSRTGKLDLETLVPLISPPIPTSVCPGVFGAFDENCDCHIDFKEMACGISAACRGPLTERQKFCFKVFDTDRDGVLSETELRHMVDVLLFVHRENKTPEELDEEAYVQVDVSSIVSEIQERAVGDGGVSVQEYLIWTVNNPLSVDFLNLIFQVCHVVLGLRPVSREEESLIVKGWLEREERRGYLVGQFWYLISMDWWKMWLQYISYTNSSNEKSELDIVPVKVTGGFEQNLSIPKKQNSGTSPVLGQEGYRLSSNTSPSHSPQPPRRTFTSPPPSPGSIDNTGLVAIPTYKVTPLTGEGGKLKRNLVLVRGRDFELVPESLWKALFHWYGGSPALPRQVILPKNSTHPELELYPVALRLLRHQAQPTRVPQTNWSNMVGGYGTAALSTTGYAYVSSMPIPPKRYLAYVATFSRMATIKQLFEFLCMRLKIHAEDMRLWHVKEDLTMVLIEDGDTTIEDFGIVDEDQLLIEVRNKDLTWPEEMSSLATQFHDKCKQVPVEKGATGLNNLGNTCFMNAALQCVSNTRALTEYFVRNIHRYELNRTNSLGMKGHIAKRYGDLIQEIWSGNYKTIAPLKLRWTIAKYAPRFNGFQQHDSQEFLAFLLDGLHEDLNRVHDKPYIELKDSDGRQDEIVAQEAWENHILRNKSIIVDLFHGQLKSKVTCKVCGHESVCFDPFNYLSLPLPMESYIHVHVIVIRLDGSIPVKYGLRLNIDENHRKLKNALSPLCGIAVHLLYLAEVSAAQIKCIPQDGQKVKIVNGGCLYAYELPDNGSSLSVEDYNPLHFQKESQTFTAIQRAVQPKGLYCGNNNTTFAANENVVMNGGKFVSEQEQMSSSVTFTKNTIRNMETGSAVMAVSENGCTQGGVVEGVPYIQLCHSSANSSSNSSTLTGLSDVEMSSGPHGFIIAVHRKMIHQETYFTSSQKTQASLFGLPLIVPCNDLTTRQDLYHAVWVQVAHLMSPLPPNESAAPNHAQDCDDSLGYEFPFILKAVNKGGTHCAWCPFYRFCRGCRIECSDTEFNFGCSYLAIDWDPTALHLRYQTSQERVFVEHESVQLTQAQQAEPINLDYCLETFTKEEDLDENEKYYCSKCQKHQLARKKLQIWKLPPILIFHLKRFQLLNGKWVKSQKVVNFPFCNFDPTAYLASVPKNGVIRHCEQELNQSCREIGNYKDPCEIRQLDSSLQDFHQLHLTDKNNPLHLKYHLYAIVAHSGILGCGHYVSYTSNPNGKWYYYNDSSCKEVRRSQIDTDSAYMLFYEQEGLDMEMYMPDVSCKTLDTQDLDDDFETDFKKFCCIM